jgi:hypothetical protein
MTPGPGRTILFWLSFFLCALLPCAAGCAGTSPGLSGWSLPFAQKSDGPQAPSPDDRIKELRMLAKQAPKLSATEQEQKSNELVAAARSETDALVRAEIFRTLGAFSTLGAGTMLYAGVQDSDPEIRIACCQAWARRGGPDAARVLGEILKQDENVDVRLAAARALGQVKDQSAVAALAPALEDPNPAMQWRAVRSLEKVTGKHFGNDVNAWRAFVQGGNPREETLVQRIGRLFY